ncbi:MAG: ABC transporter substrate-binding protein [Clostridiales bacterium]|nr:ABC transporter substrate-binding protein [Clostridiales bacterium]
MKKTLVMLLALTMLLCLVACGSSGNQGGGTTTPPAATPGTTTPSTPAATTPAAPQGPPTGPEGQEYGGVLRMTSSATFQEPFGLPWLYQTMNRPLAPFGEALLLETPYGDMSPFLAKSWDIDMDKLEITFYLRDDVTFADGSKFNAEAAKWNYDNYIEAKVMNPSVASFEARGEYELTAVLRDYNNSLLNIFASRGQCLVSKEGYEKNGEEYSLNHSIGTGPFVLTDRQPGLRVEFARRDDYWQPGKPYLDGVVYIAMGDSMTQNAAMMSSGDDGVDVVQTSAGEQIATLLANADCYRSFFPGGPYSLFPDSMNPDSVLAILEVRQALAYAIDRDAICEARGFGAWTPGVQIIPPPYPGPLPDSYNLYYDPAKSKELLAQAGYPNGFKIPMHVPAAVDRDAITAVQSMLGDVGVIAEMDFPESGASTELRNNGWDGIYVAAHSPLANAISSFRLNFDPDFLYYVSVARPPGYTEVYTKARTSLVVENELVQEIHKMFLDNMTIIPMWNTSTSYVIRSDIHDSGLGDWSSGTQWLPENAWRSSK